MKISYEKKRVVILLIVLVSYVAIGCFPVNLYKGDDAGSGPDGNVNNENISDDDLDISVDTDIDIDIDTDVDTDTDTDVDTDMDIDTDTDTDTDTNIDTDTFSPEPDCSALGWDCGGGDNGCGTILNCPVCRGENRKCDTDHHCVCKNEECNGDCCIPGQVCNEKDECCSTKTTCTAEQCGTISEGDNCGGDLVCPDCPEGNWCDNNLCKTCDNDHQHCGSKCHDCTTTSTTPYCDGNECVECLDHADCQKNPFNSPIGACTPDNTCTCWAKGKDWECDTQADCDDLEGDFVCALDYMLGKAIHWVCLRKCKIQSEESPVNGLRCFNPANIVDYVWTPTKKASCFSFKRFGEECKTHSDDECSVDGAGAPDGGVDIKDGTCHAFEGDLGYRCTYSCWDGDSAEDDWGPEVCHDSGDLSYCEYTE